MIREANSDDLSQILELYLYLHETAVPEESEELCRVWQEIVSDDNHHLVMEWKLGRFPNEQDLSKDFTPSVRFYFLYDDLVTHPGRVFDGVLPMKIKDEIVLKDWLYAMVIPAGVELDVPDDLKDRTIYVENDCRDIWDWSEKVYQTIEKRCK